MKYAPSLIGVGQLSGSSGSTTASHNRYGTYFRNRTIPTNPNSVSQQGVRGIFGGFAQRWRTLTASQRLAWSALALNIPRINSLGQSYTLAGNALYASYNLNLDACAQPVIDDAPALDSPPVISSLVVTVDVNAVEGMSAAYGATGGSGVNFIIVRASAPRSAGRDFVGRGELKQITVIAGDDASPVALEAFYEAVFGAGWEGQAGMEIVFEFAPVSEFGLAGTPVKHQATIVP